MLSKQQTAQREIDAKIRKCVSDFVREVEKVKSTPITNEYFRFFKNDKEEHFQAFAIDYDEIENLQGLENNNNKSPYWYYDDTDDGMLLGYITPILESPKEAAKELIMACVTSDNIDGINDAIKDVEEIIKTGFFSEQLIDGMKTSLSYRRYSIKRDIEERVDEKRENFLNKKVHYHPAERQRPIAHSLRGRKSSPRKTGLHQLENSVRNMW